MTIYYAPSYRRQYGNELYHYGIPGMKWGRRKAVVTSTGGLTGRRRNQTKAEREAYKKTPEYQAKKAKVVKAAKIGAAVAGTALAAYGTYKLSKAIKTKAYNKSYEKGKAIADSMFKEKYITKGNVTNESFNFKNQYGRTIMSGKAGSKTALNGMNDYNKRVISKYNENMRDVRKNANYNSKNLRNSIKYLIKG